METAFQLLGINHLQLPASWLEAASLSLLVVATFVLMRRVSGATAAAAFVGASLAAFFVNGNVAVSAAIALVAAGMALRSSRDPTLPPPPMGRAALAQVGLVVGGLLLYELARLHTEGTYAAARSNAAGIVDFERSLGLFFEGSAQSFLTSTAGVGHVFNFLYSYSFLAGVFGAMIWLFLTDQPNYRLLRNTLAVSAVLALITIVWFPVAPPRLMPELGIADTVVVMGREHGFANNYAAVPSLHVAWVAVAGLAMWRSVGGRLGTAFAVIPVAVMTMTVVVTGNHYWVDAASGAAYALVPAVLILNWERVAAAWSRYAGAAQRTWAIIVRKPSAVMTTFALSALLIYLIAGQIMAPGFTDFWGYLVFQAAATLALILFGEILFAEQGGLSWQTHVIAVSCTFLDTLGTDGNLYARIDEYDKLTHFVGVAAVTSAAYDCFRAMNLRRGGTWPVQDRFRWAIGVGLAVGLGWEMYELIGDRVFDTSRIGGAWDTSNDLVMDALGALTAGVVLRWSELGGARQRVPEVSQDGRSTSSFS